MSTLGTSIQHRAKLLKARTLLTDQDPFLGHLALSLPVRVTSDEGVPTAAITVHGQCLLGEGFVSEIRAQELATILIHETLHFALDCFHRRGPRNPTLWNIAHDLAINALIQESMESSRPWAWPVAFPPLLEPSFQNMAAEAIYKLLWDTFRLEVDGLNIPGLVAPKMSATSAKMACDRWTTEQREAASRILQNQTHWVLDLSPDGWEQVDAAAREELRLRWQGALLGAAEQAMRETGIGNLPAWAERLLGPLLTPKVPWFVVLARRVHGHLKGERRSFSRPGRRGLASGTILPSRLHHRGVVGVFVDVSGSISLKDLTEFITELKGILEQTGHAVRLLAWDVEVTRDLFLEDAAALQTSLLDCQDNLYGGGGTNPDCVIRHLEAVSDAPNPSFGVILTDGYVPWPSAEAWPMEVMVVSTGPLPERQLGYDAMNLEIKSDLLEVEMNL